MLEAVKFMFLRAESQEYPSAAADFGEANGFLEREGVKSEAIRLDPNDPFSWRMRAAARCQHYEVNSSPEVELR